MVSFPPSGMASRAFTQIHNDLLDLARIYFNQRQILGQGGRQLDVFADYPPEHLVPLRKRSG